MVSEVFKKVMLEKEDEDYGLCPPPLSAQDGLNILIKHFLGEDWYVVLPLCTEQVNTEAVYQILRKYPKKKSIKIIIRELLES